MSRLNVIAISELPPRARRIRYAQPESTPPIGTTSACAENTRLHAPRWRTTWNYLRVRGEYGSRMMCTVKSQELPPRARRILELLKKIGVKNGTTSACAENTVSAAFHYG